MRLLLDTHIAVWALAGDARLSREATKLILDARNEIHVSVASIWELAIKENVTTRRARRRAVEGARDIAAKLEPAGYAVLTIQPQHALAVADLPLIHSDPFDRMLVAQALSEPMRLLTHDERVAAYSEQIILV